MEFLRLNHLLISISHAIEMKTHTIGPCLLQVLSETYNARMAQKLGLKTYDRTISFEFLKLMYKDECDFTNAFRALSTITAAGQVGTDCCIRFVSPKGCLLMYRVGHSVQLCRYCEVDIQRSRWLQQLAPLYSAQYV